MSIGSYSHNRAADPPHPAQPIAVDDESGEAGQLLPAWYPSGSDPVDDTPSMMTLLPAGTWCHSAPESVGQSQR